MTGERLRSKLQVRSKVFTSPLEKGEARGIFFRAKSKSPHAPLFPRGASTNSANSENVNLDHRQGCFVGVATGVLIAVLGLSVALPEPLVFAQPLQKAVAMVGARSGASWPLWIAKDARFYSKYGLDVELVYAVHPGPIAAIISGHAAMTSAGSDPALLAAAKDPSLVVLGGFMNKGSFAMIGSKAATDMKQISGKKIGVGRVGDPPYHMAVSLLKKYGFTSRDVQWVSIGVDAAARAAALQTGQVDAALITAPAYFRLQAAGMPVLAVLLDHEDIYVSTYYLFRREALTKERPMATAFIKAHAEAIKRFYDDKPFATSIMIKYGGTRNADDANRVYDLFQKARVLEPIPYALKGSVEAVVERQGQDLKGADFAKMIDNSLVDQLVNEKYFETVFGAAIRDEQKRRQAQAFGR